MAIRDSDSGEMTADGGMFGSWSVKAEGRKESDASMIKKGWKEGGSRSRGLRPGPKKGASRWVMGWMSLRGRVCRQGAAARSAAGGGLRGEVRAAR